MCLICLGCSRQDTRQPVVVLHAASLSRVLANLEERFEAQNSGHDLQLEPSGSQVAARKVSELNRRADLVFSADWRVIDRLLVPKHAGWLIQFAANEIVLAHAEHSAYTAEITADNWSEILFRPQVRLGRASEDTAPLGFQTLLVWKLAEPVYGRKNLSRDLAGRCPPDRVTPDVAELVALLQSRVIDYAFVFRSIAEEHNLKMIRLPDACNLGNYSMQDAYARTAVPLSLKRGEPPVEMTGAPIVYAFTIPARAPNPEGARLAAALLLGPEGQKILEHSGFRPLSPAHSPNPERLPQALQGLVAKPAKP